MSEEITAEENIVEEVAEETTEEEAREEVVDETAEETVVEETVAEEKEGLNYEQIMGETEKPVADRQSIMNDRLGRVVVPRRFHLTDKKLEKVKDRAAEMGMSFPNPYSRGGAYYGFVQALIELGVDKWHIFRNDVLNKMEVIMGGIVNPKGQNSWERFTGNSRVDKKGLPLPTGKDLHGRIVQNAQVLQRTFHSGSDNTTPYGYKLQQLNACIDIKRDASGVTFFRLNTTFSSPEDVQPERGLNTRQRKSKA